MNLSVESIAVPETGLLRLKHIIGDAKANPPIPPIIPLKKSAWWAGVKSGRFPAPVYLHGGRAAYWRAKDIRALVESAQADPSKGPSMAERMKDEKQNPGREGQ